MFFIEKFCNRFNFSNTLFCSIEIVTPWFLIAPFKVIFENIFYRLYPIVVIYVSTFVQRFTSKKQRIYNSKILTNLKSMDLTQWGSLEMTPLRNDHPLIKDDQKSCSK